MKTLFRQAIELANKSRLGRSVKSIGPRSLVFLIPIIVLGFLKHSQISNYWSSANLLFDPLSTAFDKTLVRAIPSPHFGLWSYFEDLSSHLWAPMPIPKQNLEEKIANIGAEIILTDPLSRIGEEFQIPPLLKERTEFWLNVYSQWGDQHHIIHHTRYPWIIFEVVDTNDFLIQSDRPLWMRIQKAQKYVEQRKSVISRSLRNLARKRNWNNVSPFEKKLLTAIEPLEGNKYALLRQAASNIRSQLGQKGFFLQALRRSGQYLPYIEAQFSNYNLPIELSRLPFVESSFNEHAQSKVGASGIWQIMPSTGRQYFRVNGAIDERNSPFKATDVAIKVLRSYKNALGHWPLAVTAYNHGIGNIRKSIRRAGTTDLGKIILRYHGGSFRFASSNFYASFLAALYAEKYHDLVFPAVAKKPPVNFETIDLSRRMRVSEILNLTGLEKDVFLKYNLDLKKTIHNNWSVPKDFRIFLPPDAKSQWDERLGEADHSIKDQRA